MSKVYEHQCPKCDTTFVLKVRPKWDEVHLCVTCQRQATRERIPERVRKCRICHQRKELNWFRQRSVVCNGCILSGYERLIEDELKNATTDNGLKQCRECLEWKPIETSFYRDSASSDGYRYNCKNCLRIYRARHRERDTAAAKRRRWKNIEREREKSKRWRKKNRKLVMVNEQRRVARKKGLPSNFTKDDWQYALDYFNGCCAACGRQMNDMFGEFKPASDHWIPLSYEGSDNLGTVPNNMVPLCHGKGGCNNRKHGKLPVVWLEEQFGKRKAAEILRRIETFFTTVRKTQ